MKIKYTLHGESYGYPGSAETTIEADDPGALAGQFQGFLATLRKSGFNPRPKPPEFVQLPDGSVLCPKHGAAMRKREKQGDEWYSHNMGTEDHPMYCRGYPGKESPGYDVPARRREPGDDDEPPRKAAPPRPEPARSAPPAQRAEPRPAQPPPSQERAAINRQFGAGLDAPAKAQAKRRIPSDQEIERMIITAIQALEVAWELEQADAHVGPAARAPFVTHWQVGQAVARKLCELGKVSEAELAERPGVPSPAKHAIARVYGAEPELIDDLIRRCVAARHEHAVDHLPKRRATA